MSAGECVTLLSYLVGAGVFVWAARRKRLATEGMAIVAGVGFVAGIFGAKIAQLLAEGWPVKIPWFAVAQPQIGGRALLGGVICGWIGVEIMKRRLGIRRSTGDLFALALPAGEAVGRIGCHLNGCCYGERCDLPWAIWQHGAWRWPSQLMSSAVAALTFGALLWAAPRLRREGDLFRLYLLLFGVTRFGLESVRWRESTVLGLSPMQWFCLELVAFASVSLVWRRRRDVPQLRPGL